MNQEQEGWLQTDYQDCNKLMVLLISRMSHWTSIKYKTNVNVQVWIVLTCRKSRPCLQENGVHLVQLVKVYTTNNTSIVNPDPVGFGTICSGSRAREKKIFFFLTFFCFNCTIQWIFNFKVIKVGWFFFFNDFKAFSSFFFLVSELKVGAGSGYGINYSGLTTLGYYRPFERWGSLLGRRQSASSGCRGPRGRWRIQPSRQKTI